MRKRYKIILAIRIRKSIKHKGHEVHKGTKIRATKTTPKTRRAGPGVKYWRKVMKKYLFIIALVLAALTAAPGRAGAVESRLGSVFTKIKGLVQQDIAKWDMSETLSKEEMLDPNTKKKMKKVGIGYFWGSGPTKIWLRAKYKVPEQVLNQPVAGGRISLGVNLEDRAKCMSTANSSRASAALRAS